MKAIFKRVSTSEQIEMVVQLANIIWTEHYTPIIGKDQVAYMLSTFHSYNTISTEIKNENIHYYLILKGNKPVGYVGIRLEQKNLFLSKIYVLAEERGFGLGRQAIIFIKELAVSKGLHKIILTVNKYNSDSIEAYKKMEFQVTGNVCSDIGEGYVMDDYQMELKV